MYDVAIMTTTVITMTGTSAHLVHPWPEHPGKGDVPLHLLQGIDAVHASFYAGVQVNNATCDGVICDLWGGNR